jgi:hypothetical protein
MSKYFVQKQLIPADQNFGDPSWAKRQIWVLKLNSDDTVDSFDTIEEAKSKRDELDNADPSNRVYRVVEKVGSKYITI